MKSTTMKIAAFSAALMMPAAGWADEDHDPNFAVPDEEEEEGYDPNKPYYAELELEYFNNNSNFESENEYSATLSLGYYFNENFSINGVVLGAPVKGDGFFPNDYDFYFEELYLAAEFDRIGFFAGKFNPTFGIGYDDAVGYLYSAEYFYGYELVERLGVGATYTFGDASGGEHTLGASAFQLDTSSLARSFFRGEQLASRADGGLSNHSGLGSYNLWLEGNDAFGVENSRYNITYRSQDGGMPGEETETGFAIGGAKLFELANGNELEVYAELVSLDNSLDEGISFDQDSLMATGAYYFGDDWVASLGGGIQRIGNSSDTAEMANGNNNFVTASIGRNFGDLYAELAYKRDETNGVSSNSAGIFLYYGLEF